MKKLMSVLLILALVLSLSCVAFAADGAAATTYDLSAAKMDKELTVADGIDISAVKTFTFSFTAGSSVTAATADHPEIAAKTIEVGTQSGGKATGELALSNVFTASAFPHAGEYVYTVKETTAAINTTANGVTKTLTVDSTEYTVRVYVKNNAAGTALEIAGITVENGTTKEKVDPTNKGFIFKNEYKEELAPDSGAVLTVNKTITGAYADKTKEFPISVVLTLPSTATAADVAVATGATWDADTLTASANLADGGKIEFTKLPAGTTFVVKETQDALYQSKTTGYVNPEDTAYVAGDVNKNGAGPITEAGKTVTIENNREDVIPTGVIIHNLPYVLLVLVAAAGLVYLVMKKRAYNA